MTVEASDEGAALKIVSHHIGGRAGSIGLPIPKRFEADVINVLFEADEDCVAQALDWWKRSSNCETRVYPYCLWREDGEIDFSINFDPFTSSIYPFNEDYSHYYQAVPGEHYVLGEACRTVQVRQLAARSLDSLVSEGTVPAPDFLSIDTQGSEWDILSGAVQSIAQNLLAIKVEVTFAEIYRAQKLFGDTHTLLTGAGFELFDLSSVAELSCARGPIGTRGRHQPGFSDALYFRRLDAIPAGRTASSSVALHKLAAISAWFGFVEYSLEAIAKAKKTANRTRGLTVAYMDFLGAVESAARQVDGRFLPTFGEKHTFAQSQARFMATGKSNLTKMVARHGARPLRRFFYRLAKVPEMRRAALLERVFRQYGLTSVAALLKRNRRRDIRRAVN